MSPATDAGQRATLLAGAVDHVLAQGIGTLSLRPLAAALGTSDRMLIYWFGTRDALLTAVLAEVGTRLQAALDAALPPEPVPPTRLLAVATGLTEDPDAEPYLRLYVELSGLAAAGREPFRSATTAIAEEWLAWTADRLDDTAGDPEQAAVGVLAALDGILLVRFVLGAGHAERAAAWLGDALRGRDT